MLSNKFLELAFFLFPSQNGLATPIKTHEALLDLNACVAAELCTYRIHEENTRGRGQVEPHPPGFERQKHDFGAVRSRALKLLDDASSLLLAHRAVQTHETETVFSGEEEEQTPVWVPAPLGKSNRVGALCLPEWALKDAEEACKLRDDQALGVGVFGPQPEQVSHQRLNLQASSF